MSGLEIRYSGASFNRLAGLLNSFPDKVIKEFKVAVEYSKGIIVKDFMTVQDGGRKNGRYSKRTKFPGVRVQSGALRRGVNTTGKVEIANGELLAKIYVPDNVSYGSSLERNPKYAFLKPGFEKSKKALNEMLIKIRGHFQK